MNEELINYSISILREDLSKITSSLPDDPAELYRKIYIAFPKLIKSIGALKVFVLKDTIIKIKCKNFTIFMCRSKKDYTKMDILIRKGDTNVVKKENVFFEDLERVITSASTSKLNEYEVGDLNKIKPKQSTEQKKQKIGTNSSNVKNVATSLSSAMSAVTGQPSIEKDIVANTNDKFDDLDKVINTSQFRTAVNDDKVYQKIKKNYSTIKQNKI